MDQITQSWIAEGLMVIDADGVPIWTPAAMNMIRSQDRILLSDLRTKGRESFIDFCNDAGVNPDTLLQTYGLSRDDEDYGTVLTDA